MTEALVERLETSPSGREVTRVVLRQDGQLRHIAADIVVVSCGAINSAALLLRSASDQHPNGLGNRSDTVGRFYMCHNNSALLALSLKSNPTRFQKTLGINDFYWGDGEWEYPLGHIQMLGKTDAAMFKGETHGLLPGRALDELARHSLDFWLTGEDLPRPDNRITLAGDSLRISYTPTNQQAHHRLTDKLRGLLRTIGCEPSMLVPRQAYFSKRLLVAATGHQNGTIRFGTDPAGSALDVNCRSHEVDNLYVVDGSFFPSSSAVNPTLTIIANALRVAAHVQERLGPATAPSGQAMQAA
jgi:choline dehydrogenase-like flavoprotein